MVGLHPRQILQSDPHLLEIELLRRGRRIPMERPLPSTAYFVFLTRAGERPYADIWPIPLDGPVPLLAGDPDVPLDLRAAFTRR